MIMAVSMRARQEKKEEDEECHLCCSPRRASPGCHFRLLSATLGLTNNDMPAQHRSWLVFVSHHHHRTETLSVSY